MKDIKPTLLILAAGLSSRYKGGLKQMDSFGPSGEKIMDYSIYDALHAGFAKIVFVIQKKMKNDFEKIVISKYADKIDYDFAFQEMDDLPAGYNLSLNRVKPWGTGHAVWAARHIIKEPFAVINADDFYGSESYSAIAEFLGNQALRDKNKYAMVGFNLQNTVSEHGSVSRGVCTIRDGHLLDINERTHIERNQAGIIAYKDEKGIMQSISPDTVVSMNFWGFLPDFFFHCEESFKSFLNQLPATDFDSEFFLPGCIKELMKSDNIKVKVLNSSSKWLGVTYADDKPVVKERLRSLHDIGLYPTPLF